MRPSITARAIALAGLTTTALAQEDNENPCQSFGIDFQDEGSYFQNASSTDPFTFVSVFQGCQPDVANNLLVDPNGDEYQCTDTELTPDDTNQLSTCPLNKNELSDGDWSVIIISNNGAKGDPIAYERDFVLSVGTPVTTTTTPARVTTTTTRTQGTVKRTAHTVSPTVITKTHTQICSIPPRQPRHDPWCTITPTLLSAAALSTPTPTSTIAPRRRRDTFRRVPTDRAQRVTERKARLSLAARGLDKRDVDVATTTVTDLNTSDYDTTTATFTDAPSTIRITSEFVTSTTFTSTSTKLKGTTTLSVVTITAPTPTKTKTEYTVYTTTVNTITHRPKITVTVTTAPPISTTICRAKGGKLV